MDVILVKMFKVIYKKWKCQNVQNFVVIGNKNHKKNIHFDVLKLFDVQLHVSMTDI